MRKAGVTDVSGIAREIESRLAEIDRRMGSLVYEYAVIPAARTAESLTPVPDNGYPLLNTDKLFAMSEARERAAWERLAQNRLIAWFLEKSSPQTRENISQFMGNNLGFCTLLSMKTNVQKIALVSAGAGAFTLAGTDLVAGFANTALMIPGVAELGVTPAAAAMGSAGLLVVAGVGTARILSTSINYRLHSSHEKLREKIEEWNSNLDKGWSGFASKLIAKAFAAIITPYPPLSPEAHRILKGGLNEELPASDARAVGDITEFLKNEFALHPHRAGIVAGKLLTQEEPDPSRLMSRLRTRHLPGRWIDEYGINPGTCIRHDPEPFEARSPALN
jgi:hypothetical protein